MTNSNLKRDAFWLLLPLAAGAVSGFFTRSGMADYMAQQKPALTPPAVLFPIVWTILYLLMGISAMRIAQQETPSSKQALTVFSIQLAVNFLWSFFFFTFQAYFFSLLWLILLWVLILWMIRLFYSIDRAAAYLQIPYLLWVTFAGYLTAAVWLLNR